MEAGLICRAVQTERFRCDLGRFRLGVPIANARRAYWGGATIG